MAHSPPESKLSVAGDQNRWFIEEIQPHESSLRSYLKGSFPTVRDVDDLVQESYIRLLAAHSKHPIQSARALLFVIARRVAIDLIRKERRSSANEVAMDIGAFSVLEENADAAERSSAQQEITLLAEAIHSLPARCREIMILRKIERLSHREIARRLGLSVSTVEGQISRGMEKCARYLRSRGVEISPRRTSS